MSANNLTHFGVLGMKWGRRKGNKTPGSQDHQRSRELRKKKLKDLSNEELKTLSKRLELEKRYSDLNPGIVRRGASTTGRILKALGAVVGTVATVTTLAGYGKKVYEMAKGRIK